ncbi:MAG: shikimate dehydrogenase, partial [Brevundimonas sp.]|nr:shikimate dehydrogenase [Brevundimonas sp.]
MTIRAGVAGQPISHSLSPLLHGLWIEAAGLDATYEAFGPDDADGFARLIAEGRAGRLRGLNVTSPFKEQALAAADEVSAIARACGSANRLVFENGRVLADSTDGRGLMLALSEQAPNFDPKGAPVVVLGAGGAARAAVVALKAAGADVGVLNRTRERAETLAAELGSSVARPEAVRDAALIVNALSVRPEIDIAGMRADA